MAEQIFDDKINISIRWKIVGAFLIASGLPLVLIRFGVSVPTATILGLVIAGAFGIYSGWRIVRSLEVIQHKLDRIPGGASSASGHADELQRLMGWADHVVTDLEEAVARSPDIPTPQRKAIDPEAHTIIRGRHASGMPVSGDLLVIRAIGAPSKPAIPEMNISQRRNAFDSIVQEVHRELDDLKNVLTNEDEHGILSFQTMLLEDDTFLDEIVSAIDRGLTIRDAIEESFTPFIQKLAGSENAYMREREQDCHDLMRRLAMALDRKFNSEKSATLDVKDRIVYAPCVFPSDIVEWKKQGLAGLVLRNNSLTSHTQILLQSLAIPSVSQFDADLKELNDRPVHLNPQKRRIIINPQPADCAIEEGYNHEIPAMIQPAHLSSGEPIHVHASIGLALEAPGAMEAGADGIGLYRSEFSFMAEHELPDEQALYEEYAQVTSAFSGKPVIFRMLDLGGDKIAAFHSHFHEDNPSMGVTLDEATHKPSGALQATAPGHAPCCA